MRHLHSPAGEEYFSPIGGHGGALSWSSPRRIAASSNESSRPASRSSRPILTARMTVARSSAALGTESPLATPFVTWRMLASPSVEFATVVMRLGSASCNRMRHRVGVHQGRDCVIESESASNSNPWASGQARPERETAPRFFFWPRCRLEVDTSAPK